VVHGHYPRAVALSGPEWGLASLFTSNSTGTALSKLTF